jgi:hypothetical protein
MIHVMVVGCVSFAFLARSRVRTKASVLFYPDKIPPQHDQMNPSFPKKLLPETQYTHMILAPPQRQISHRYCVIGNCPLAAMIPVVIAFR